MGCICCRAQGVKNGAEIHHIVSAGRRQGHEQTLPLCAYHHRGVTPPGMTSRDALNLFGPSRHHHGRRMFEDHWGTEQELLQKVNDWLTSS
jgi:hypothetical protein